MIIFVCALAESRIGWIWIKEWNVRNDDCDADIIYYDMIIKTHKRNITETHRIGHTSYDFPRINDNFKGEIYQTICAIFHMGIGNQNVLSIFPKMGQNSIQHDTPQPPAPIVPTLLSRAGLKMLFMFRTPKRPNHMLNLS